MAEGVYKTIVADPPWPMPDSGRRTPSDTGTRLSSGGTCWDRHAASVVKIPYSTMTVADITALPVADLANDAAHLYLWTTNRFLEAAYAVVRGWGFRPAQMLVWAKPPMGIGFGGAFTTTTEFILFARRGTLAHSRRQDSSWWGWSRQYQGGVIAHSQKPDAFLDMVESVSPPPRLELFARRQRLGWDTWGDEAMEHVQIGAR